MPYTPRPYVADPTIGAQSAAATRQYGLQQSNLNFQRGNLQQQKRQDFAGLAYQYGKMREALPGQYAGRGLLNSGIYQQGIYDFNRQKQQAAAALTTKWQGQLGANHFQALDNTGRYYDTQAQLGAQNQKDAYDWSLQEAEKQSQAALADQLRGVR